MAELTLRLEIDPATGKRNVIIGYRGDEDALPMEHEDDHRQLVDRLIEGGALDRGELGEIIVERVEEARGAGEAPATEQDQQAAEGLTEDQ